MAAQAIEIKGTKGIGQPYQDTMLAECMFHWLQLLKSLCTAGSPEPSHVYQKTSEVPPKQVSLLQEDGIGRR